VLAPAPDADATVNPTLAREAGRDADRTGAEARISA